MVGGYQVLGSVLMTLPKAIISKNTTWGFDVFCFFNVWFQGLQRLVLLAAWCVGPAGPALLECARISWGREWLPLGWEVSAEDPQWRIAS